MKFYIIAQVQDLDSAPKKNYKTSNFDQLRNVISNLDLWTEFGSILFDHLKKVSCACKIEKNFYFFIYQLQKDM